MTTTPTPVSRCEQSQAIWVPTELTLTNSRGRSLRVYLKGHLDASRTVRPLNRTG